jgi:hypothetical protein
VILNLLRNTIFVLALGLAVSSVFGKTPPEAYVATSPDGSVVVTLYTTPCDNKVTPIIHPQLLPQLKAGKVVVPGKSLDACWGQVEDEIVVLMENGTHGSLPSSEFKPLDGA